MSSAVPAPFDPPGIRQHAAALLLLLFAFARLLATEPYKAPTMDEPHHIARGLLYLRLGQNVWNGNPPLANILTAAPLLLDPGMVPDSARLLETRDFHLLGQVFLQTVQAHWRAAFFAARLPNMLMLLVLLALLARWVQAWFGPMAGAVTLLLCAFDPNLLANAQLATTDLPVTLFCTAAGYQAWRFGRSGRWRDALGLGLSAGLALSAKFNALVVLALIGLALVIAWPQTWRRRLPRTLAAVGLSALVVWAVYGFQFGPAVGVPVRLPAADYVGELLWQSTTNVEQHRAFLADRLYTAGSPAYFPLALLLKTPTAVLILLAAALGGMAFSARMRSARLLLPAAVFGGYFATFILLPLNIGYRHLLPILPFGYVLIGALFRRPRPMQLIGGGLTLALVGWTAASSLAVFPYDLAYFAEWTGGPARGYRWLVDANLDWGQDLYALPRALRDETVPIYLSYFGPTDPRLIGLLRSPLPSWDRGAGEAFHPANPDPGVYAISATNLQGILLRDPDAFDFFRRRAPAGQVGFSILLYRVAEANRPLKWIAACETPDVPLEATDIERLLGSGHRTILFDCRQSWVIPRSAEGGPGWYVLPGEMGNAAQAWGGATRLVYRQANRLGVYAYDPAGFELAGAPAVTFSDTLTFLGARLAQPNEVVTFWRVVRPASSALSIFGHRLAEDGYTLEVSDGLGVSPAEWQPGDILLQWHKFTSPPSPEEFFDTGVYNWQTGERLLTPDGQDHLALSVRDFSASRRP